MSYSPDDDAIAGKTRENGTAVSGTENICAEIESYIIAKPFRALAIALLSGIVVGKLIL
jgi:ElaB/YqjD/DUF883 family membrane-anchored ribosome-binding protein